MTRKWLCKWIGIFGLVSASMWLLSLSSCARSTRLTGITIQPSTGTFGAVDPSANFGFKAFGTYIHPPKTVDITDQVNWQSNNPQVIQITSAGVASPNIDCGVAQVFAEMHSGDNDIASNSATITVDGPSSLGCTPAGPLPILTVTVAGTITGTVTSSPAGITCSVGSSCSSQFATGTTVTLTAAPASSFQSWSNCNTTNGASCTVFLENSTTVTATFN
jgi:hypothetical protein